MWYRGESALVFLFRYTTANKSKCVLPLRHKAYNYFSHPHYGPPPWFLSYRYGQIHKIRYNHDNRIVTISLLICLSIKKNASLLSPILLSNNFTIGYDCLPLGSFYDLAVIMVLDDRLWSQSSYTEILASIQMEILCIFTFSMPERWEYCPHLSQMCYMGCLKW